MLGAAYSRVVPTPVKAPRLVAHSREVAALVGFREEDVALQLFADVFGGNALPALGWLEGGVVEPNFDPDHDRRLRQMMKHPGVRWGVGIPAGAALLRDRG